MALTTKDILKFERIKRGWKQEDIAEMLKMARGSYAKYENGDNTPTTENIIKLAELYNVTTDYLLCHNIKTSQFLKDNFKSGITTGEEIAEELKKTKRVRKKKTSEN